MQGTAQRQFSALWQLCGPKFYKHVVLGTTFWRELEKLQGGEAIGEQRLEELQAETGIGER